MSLSLVFCFALIVIRTLHLIQMWVSVAKDVMMHDSFCAEVVNALPAFSSNYFETISAIIPRLSDYPLVYDVISRPC
jgi:hypothetical protein